MTVKGGRPAGVGDGDGEEDEAVGGPGPGLPTTATLTPDLHNGQGRPERADNRHRLHVGSRIADRFVIRRVVGDGGMGVVYEAHDSKLNRRVAIKQVRAARSRDRDWQVRALREAQAIARLSHPNVIAVYDALDVDDGVCIAMEFVEGRVVNEWLADGDASWREVLDVHVQALRGLAAAHRVGIVHRDFKPRNVMVGDDGRVRVLDFGLARANGAYTDARGDARTDGRLPDPTPQPELLDLQLTATGVAIGTPAYMAPEQMRGETAGPAADQFSWFLSLYEGLHGTRPFAAQTRSERLERVRAGIAPPAPGTPHPRWLHELMARGLSYRPSDRWPSTDALLAVIDKQLRRPRRAVRMAMAAIALVAALAAVSLWLAWRVQTEKVAKRDMASELRRMSAEGSDRAQVAAALEYLLPGVRRVVDPTRVAVLLRDVQRPDEVAGWLEATALILQTRISQTVLHGNDIESVQLSSDGARVVTAASDGSVRVWRADGIGQPVDLIGHTGRVFTAIFDRDARSVLTASEDGTARVWRADGSGPPVVLAGHTGAVRSAAFSPDGQRVATASEDGTARVWRADGSGEPRVLSGHDGPVNSVQFAPDGRSLVSASEDGAARVWNERSRPDEPVVLAGHTGPVLGAEFSSDGHRVLTVSGDGSARVWPVVGDPPTVVLSRSGKPIQTAHFSADGQWIVTTAARDVDVRVWRADGTGEAITPSHFQGTREGVLSAEFSPDGRQILMVSRLGRAWLWQWRGLRQPVPLPGPDVDTAHFSDNGQWIVTASRDGTTQVWSTDSPGALVALAGHEDELTYAEFSPDSHRLVTASSDGTARIWAIDGAVEPVALAGHTARVSWARFSPDGRFVVTASADHTARVWHADGSTAPVVLTGHEGEVYDARFSPDGLLVVTASKDRTARIWPSDGRGEPIILAGHQHLVYRARFSPDGRHVATGGFDGTVRMWRSDGTGEPRTLFADLGHVHTVEFSHDGRWLAAGGTHGRLRLVATDGSGEGRALSGHGSAISWLHFSADGRHLASASLDLSARIWSLEEESAEATVLAGHEGLVNHVEFSPDGRWIVTCSEDGTARLWQRDAVEKPLVLRGHRAPVRRARFSSNGRHLVTVSADRVALLWTLPPSLDSETLHGQLRAATTACLTAEQRMRDLGEKPAIAREMFYQCEQRFGRRPPRPAR